ncbi:MULTISPECIES: Rv2231c family pyridoxal phosphate-dependent protein CobC [unclassified Saccharopolyspora]|uniref:Rv2231c family pyridoxal phosphate-dependent protein CobC n=1 Tax=unclassified Saccharopolyspora TaxID=2646250 RepID=UPI001CD6FA24|nr:MULTISPECIES: Rv2231c family pyridoxal phosphate-dependent protein CobC [unclassified Saccharopolyspora]MCA1192552.1 Rv2231c family pyridoxal phosphate-dependent protein CobC [Saccharopolyspora sp. 6V]MCA1225313.1 Rv2231c family pyridoxal phosphate-dependent protein CobC [Saccharopolyspora sp. 6M]
MTSGDERALLRHHGDVDAEPGLLDFAVNVRLERPPRWLREHLASALDDLGRYPSAADDLAARAAVAERHRRDPAEVLLLSGAAELFALLPGLRPSLAAVVHPSFTEPEFALRAADVPVRRVLLDEHRLDPALVPDEADLVVLGNPTNPTSVLHPAATIRRLARPGRLVVVDEAFSDAVPGEPESLAAQRIPGVLVVRSLTKTWALPGLRAGYALGEPELLARLAAPRPHWPLGTLALAAITACCAPQAVAEAERAAVEIAEARDRFAADLAAVPGVAVAGPARGPFLLLEVHNGEKVRAALRERGIAVRRGDTFPGLGPDHLRVAVRDAARNAVLVRALRELLG